MNIDDLIANEEKERLEFESKTIVTKQGETIADLRKAFELVQNSENWKNQWAAAVHHSIVGKVIRAVKFYHADTAEVVGIQDLTGLVLMRGNGYMA